MRFRVRVHHGGAAPRGEVAQRPDELGDPFELHEPASLLLGLAGFGTRP
jgi:hypothetical protein